MTGNGPRGSTSLSSKLHANPHEMSFTKPIVLLGCLFVVVSCSADQETGQSQEMALRTMEAMGGSESLDDIRYLRFDFEVEINGDHVYTGRHLWDRESGRYREEWDLFGEQAQALFNVNTRSGSAYRGGEEVDDAEREELIEQAYYNHLTDSYWLLMPWKMTDPGVHLSSLGRDSIDGKTYDVLHLSFDEGVGESSGDQHWLFINPESGMVELTAYFLERFEIDEPSLDEATICAWSDWTETGGVQFARNRRVLSTVHDTFETAHSRVTLVVALDDVDDVVFESLSVSMPNN